MLCKSKEIKDQVRDLLEMFNVLRRYGMKLNPLKCAFGVSSGKFLGFMVNAREIEVNPEQIEALKSLKSPFTRKEMQSLNGKVVFLSRFISRATNKCIHFFGALKKEKGKFVWTTDYEAAFQELLEHLSRHKSC